MPAQLLALTEGPNILLDKPILLLGRHPECDIQIESRKVSRRHCCIAQVNDYLVVRDLGSTNGIRINGIRVAEGRLQAGDELTIGSHRYQVHWDDARSRRKERPANPSTQGRPEAPPRPDDASLESYDEPVPLAESGQPLAASVLQAAPVTPPHAEPAEAPLPAAPEPPSPPPIIPDQLDLESSSGVLPPGHGPVVQSSSST